MSVQTDGCVPLVRVTRSGVQDTLHRGAAVVVDHGGETLLRYGDPGTRAYIRSAAKPIQCIPVLTSGAADAFRLTDADIAIISGSHRGGPAQVRQVRSILRKCGCSERHLQSGTGIRDNCSGKHAGMLAVCRRKRYRIRDYTNPSHPHQLAILAVLQAVCGLEDGDVHVGVDGCSAPIHDFAIGHMALGYARMSVAEEHFDPATASAIRRITTAMERHPGGHTGEPPYAEVLDGEARLLTKAGGNGVYCAGAVGRGIGFAVKVEDGSRVPLIPVFSETLRRVGLLTDSEAAGIAERFWPRIVNRRGEPVGTIELLV